ncbi:fructose-bisphosphate aldolase class II [Virgibacillus halotolerans]|uniref:class II fructose-1,6-bisphosphate aldolase n=1 Tax=Virgibacillus halotolerans TaxID=1071053 RepID=UPI0019613835|nr:class II fructose-1,6-bisphosphate aldolase [Virgibacillus halotolerans]MBM7599012.1 fructose-bisphosphate aldolase class II [Virgibacillus halotolerans]
MGFVPVTEMLREALKGQYAIGHFDIHNIEWTQAVLCGAEEMNSPVILGVTEDAVNYFQGYSVVKNTALSLMQELNITVPVALHLDHGSSVESCIAAIDAGFSSVMIDASTLPLEENIKITKQVVEYAHVLDVSVEAEIGSIGGEEGSVISEGPVYTDLNECIEIKNNTNIDTLAPALGSAHGLYKGKPKIDFEKMRDISSSLKIPLVLHGASGLSERQIQEAIQSGTAKINVNADNHVAFTKAIRKVLDEDSELYNTMDYLKDGKEAVKQTVIEKIKMFGSSGKAK